MELEDAVLSTLKEIENMSQKTETIKIKQNKLEKKDDIPIIKNNIIKNDTEPLTFDSELLYLDSIRERLLF